MELNLTPAVLKKWASVLILFAVVAIAAVYTLQSGLLDGLLHTQSAEAGKDEQPGADAAIAGVEAVFTLDYEESEADWLERVCAVSTKAGCDMAKTFLAPSFSTLKVDAKAQTGSTAEALRLVEHGDETDGVGDDETVVYSWQVWEVAVTLDTPWSEVEGQQMNNLFVQVTNEEGEWKFARILFDEETKRYAEENNDVQ